MSTTLWLALLTALVASPAWAFHTVFSYRVDRIELDGNTAGPYDGVSDVVDDFNDGSLGPTFYNPYGTATESGGYLVLQSPGDHFPMPGGGLTDVTIAASTGTLVVYKGQGSFTAKATWERNLPPVGHHYHFSLFTYGGAVALYNEIFGVAVLRSDTSLQLEQHLTEIDQTTGVYRNTMLDYVDIDEADVTGDIVIRLSVENTTSWAYAQVSLDGGTTWLAPFSPAPVFQGRTIGQFLLSADPVIDGAPTTTTTSTPTTTTTTTSVTLPDVCDASQCRRSLGPDGMIEIRQRNQGRSSFKWRYDAGAATALSEFGDPVGTTAYTMCLKAGTRRWVNSAGATGLPPCGKAPCWKRTKQGWRFKGEWAGLKRIDLGAGASGKTKIMIVSTGDGAGLLLPLETPVEMVLRASNGLCWAATYTAPGVIVSSPSMFRAEPTN